MAETSVRDLFDAVLDLPADERAAFLDRACGGDSLKRARVERLLAAREGAGDFLAVPTIVTRPAEPEWRRTSVGPYTALEQIGEGGFGTVLRARQDAPIRREVALKVLKPGMDTGQVIARFEAERQALALMDHPGIARVFDAGSTESGRPYFAMELVNGQPITSFCDTSGLGLRQRLELFQQVCNAVQHAHQKGIIHRDLKPANVLITTVQGQPSPKIIDFGIAKAVGGVGMRLTERTLFTEQHQLVGTPQYMSPEQAEGSQDIDTRTDIYSLGVLLYELLTGTTPFDAERLRAASLSEVQRIIREEEPPRPSTRVSLMKDAATAAAEQRKFNPARLAHSLRSDLDWVVMKCLEKERARRYETANGLAMDIGRYLAGEPVVAAPPSMVYRARKFLRRRRGPVTTAAASLLLLVSATVLSTSFWIRAHASAEQARDAEERATAQLWDSYLAQSRARRRTLEMGRRFDSLEIVRRMAAIRPSVEVRNEAIAVLALLDARVSASTPEHPLSTVFAPSAAPEQLLVGHPSGVTEVRRIADYAHLGSIPRHIAPEAWIYATSFSSDASRVALRTTDQTGRTKVSVWSLPRGELCREVDAENDFALSPEGDLLAAVGEGRLRMIEVATGKELWSLPAPPDSFLYFRPEHGQLSVAPQFKQTLKLLSAETGKEEAEVVLPGEVGGMCWSPRGDRLALGCLDFAIRVSNAPDLNSWTELRGHQGLATELYFDPEGEFLLTDSWDSTARMWDLTTERCILLLPAGKAWPGLSREVLLGYEWCKPRGHRVQQYELARPRAFRRVAAPGLSHEPTEHPFLAVHPKLPLVVTGCADTKTLIFWSPDLNQVLGSCEVAATRRAAFSAGGDRLYTAGAGGLEEYPLALDGEVLRVGPARVLQGGGHIFAVAESGRFAVGLPGWGSDSAYRVELDGSGKVTEVALTTRAVDLRISQDDRYVAFSSWHHPDVNLWDQRDGSIRRLGLEQPAFAIFSPDGRSLVASFWGGGRVYDALSLRSTFEITLADTHTWPAQAAFSPDGTVYARMLDSNRVRLFSTDSFAELGTLESPDLFGIHSIAFTRNHRLIALTNRRNVLYVWDLSALRAELRELGLDWQGAAGSPTMTPDTSAVTLRAVLQTSP